MGPIYYDSAFGKRLICNRRPLHGCTESFSHSYSVKRCLHTTFCCSCRQRNRGGVNCMQPGGYSAKPAALVTPGRGSCVAG